MIGILLDFIIKAVILGFVLWLVNVYVPMPAIFKNVINFIAAITLLVWFLRALI